MGRTSDVVIVGSGLAGFYSSLQLDSSLKVTVLTKGKWNESNSYLAQGGIATPLDAPESHIRDTLKAGAGLCNLESVCTLVDEANDNLKNLQGLGVRFDQENQRLSLTREGGHDRPRVIHIGGDATGQGIMDALFVAVSSRKNIEVKEHTFCISLLIKNGRCVGVATLEDGRLRMYSARAVIMATGGIGMVYGVTSNSPVATGDGIAMGFRVGTEIQDMEFIQFHPTVFWGKGKRFLISEAVRGEGAFLRNVHGHRFMYLYDERKELAPRDIVARAIINEMKKTDSSHVYLDLTHIDKNHVYKRFPNIAAKCKECGIDITGQMVPVAPAQHYLMGGIKTDIWARTNIPGLYACGETAFTGVHGANRLASNSLLEALVFSNRACKMINAEIKGVASEPVISEKFHERFCVDQCDATKERLMIQETMREYAGIVRSKKGLEICNKMLSEIEASLKDKACMHKEFVECMNIFTSAKLITGFARKREISVGAHYLIE